MDKNFEILKIVIDKGLLAIVVAAFAWILARSMERLKASLSWSGELLKQRMDAAKRILREMQELKQIYLQVLGSQVVEGTGTSDPRDLFSAIRRVEELRIEFSILQADLTVLEAVDRIVKLASDVIGSPIPGTPGRLIEGEDGRPMITNPSAERSEWMRQRQEQMTGAMRGFENALAKGFPS